MSRGHSFDNTSIFHEGLLPLRRKVNHTHNKYTSNMINTKLNSMHLNTILMYIQKTYPSIEYTKTNAQHIQRGRIKNKKSH